MIVSKRGLLKVIILLAIVDVIAGLWYFTVLVENSGESHEFGLPDIVTETADTVAEHTIPDSMKTVRRHGYFVAKANGDTSRNLLASVRLANARIPVSINGNDSLDVLYRTLVRKAFGTASDDFVGGMDIYTSHPDFNRSNNPPYNEVYEVPETAPDHTITEVVTVYPLYTSNCLMVWQIDFWKNSGGNKTRTSAYVHYDRLAQQVLNNNDILAYDSENRLLTVLNEKIADLNNNDPSLNLRDAVKVPDEMCVRRTGISFMFPPGEIASADKGEIEVMLPHNMMKGIYTRSFVAQLNASTGWWRYKKLKN